MSTWTPELKEKVIQMYKDAEPSPESSTEIIKDIADEIDMSANGIRMVLVQAGVYVKKEATAGSASDKSTAKKTGEGSKRISKESAIADLRAAIEAKNVAVDEDIIGKLTGKAAVYFISVLKA